MLDQSPSGDIFVYLDIVRTIIHLGTKKRVPTKSNTYFRVNISFSVKLWLRLEQELG